MTQPDFQFDAVVVGAGVVGLALARALALTGRTTALLEAEPMFGSGISSRNSEVIHAGIYYAPGSLKAALCVPGNRALYAYCESRAVPTKRLGKLIVAANEKEMPVLQTYLARARQNGVHDLCALDANEVHAIEPAVAAVAGLWSPSTGIIDSHALMQALLTDFEQAGGMYVAHSPVTGGWVAASGACLQVDGREPCTISASIVINAAGMGAQKLARLLDGFPAQHIPALHYAVGHYFVCNGRTPFRHLVYPVASSGGLGIHLTLDLAGQARFGPDIAWCETENYAFDASREASFYHAIRRYWPALPQGALAAGYTGIRPKLYGPAQPEQDFMISGPQQHGISGLLHLFGIESPGLTACLPLAEYVLQCFDS